MFAYNVHCSFDGDLSTPSANNMKNYSFADVCGLTEASRSQFTHWTRQRLIVADLAETTGSGHHRRFSFFNVVQAHIAVRLHRLGVLARVIRTTLVWLRLFEAAAGEPDNEIEAALHSLIQKAMRRTNKPIRASRERVAQVTNDLVAEHLDDVRRWREIRRPGPERNGLEFYGLYYAYDHAEEGVSPRIMAVPMGAAVCRLRGTPRSRRDPEPLRNCGPRRRHRGQPSGT